MTKKRISPVLWFALIALVFLISLIAVAAFTGPKPDPAFTLMSAETEGEEWPFTFREGKVECVSPASVIITDTATNTTYSVNGRADGEAAARGWADISPVWRETGMEYAPKVSISSVISEGLKLCR